MGRLHRNGRDRRRHVGQGRTLREQRQHLGLRLARGGLDELLVARRVERVVQERNRGERELAPLDAREQVRKAPGEPGGLDAPARLVLGHAQPPDAELEHRRTRRLEVQTTLLHLDEVGEQSREQHATLAADRLQTLEQLRLGEIGEVHACVVHPRFGRPGAPRGRAIARETAAAVWRSRKAARRRRRRRDGLLRRRARTRAAKRPRSRQEKSIDALTKANAERTRSRLTQGHPRTTWCSFAPMTLHGARHGPDDPQPLCRCGVCDSRVRAPEPKGP